MVKLTPLSSLRPVPGSLRVTLSETPAAATAAAGTRPRPPGRHCWTDPGKQTVRRPNHERGAVEPAILQQAHHRPVRLTRATASVPRGCRHTEGPFHDRHPGDVEQHKTSDEAQQHKNRTIDRLAAITPRLRCRILGKLTFDSRLVKELHQVHLHQPHQRQTLLDQGELLGRAMLSGPTVRETTSPADHL